MSSQESWPKHILPPIKRYVMSTSWGYWWIMNTGRCGEFQCHLKHRFRCNSYIYHIWSHVVLDSIRKPALVEVVTWRRAVNRPLLGSVMPFLAEYPKFCHHYQIISLKIHWYGFPDMDSFGYHWHSSQHRFTWDFGVAKQQVIYNLNTLLPHMVSVGHIELIKRSWYQPIYHPLNGFKKKMTSRNIIFRCISRCSDAIMSAMPSQISGVSIDCSTVCLGTDQRKHQSSASLAFERGIRRWPVVSLIKGQ